MGADRSSATGERDPLPLRAVPDLTLLCLSSGALSSRDFCRTNEDLWLLDGMGGVPCSDR